MQTVAQQISDEGSPIVSGSPTIIYPRKMVLCHPIFHLNVQWFLSDYFPTLLKNFDLLGVMERVLEHIPAAFGPKCAYVIWEIPDWYWHNKVCFHFSLIALLIKKIDMRWTRLIIISQHTLACMSTFYIIYLFYIISVMSVQNKFWKVLKSFMSRVCF